MESPKNQKEPCFVCGSEITSWDSHYGKWLCKMCISKLLRLENARIKISRESAKKYGT